MEMLNEHEAVDVQKKGYDSGDYEANEKEQKTKRLVMKLLGKAKKHRKLFDESWLDDYKMFRGKQWKDQRPSYRHSAVLNVIFQGIQSMVPILTDSRPKIEFLPQEPQDRELADILNDLISSDWESGNWLMSVVECLYDSHFFGTGVASMSFEYDEDPATGKIKFESIDPMHVFPQPYVCRINESKSRYFLIAEPSDVTELRRQYPEKRDKIKADLNDLANDEKYDFSKARFLPPDDRDSKSDWSGHKEGGKEGLALKITCYIKDDRTQDVTKTSRVEQADPDGVVTMIEKEEIEQEMLYPYGRKIVIAGGCVVEDGENPYEDGKFPFAKIINYPDPHSFWGISEVEQIRDPQKIYNKIFSFILDTMNLMGNPQWVVDITSGVDTDFITNRPGEVIEKNPGSEVRREAGVGLPPFIQNLMSVVRAEIDNTMGSQDISRGAKPEGGLPTSGIAIESLQEAAQTRLRQKSRNIDAFLQEIGQMYVSRVFQYYTVPRVFRVTNAEGAQKYFKFHVEHMTDTQTGAPVKMARVRQFVDQENGTTAMGDEKMIQMQGQFDVKVSTGSSLAFLKDRKRREVLELVQLGIADQQYALEQLDIPGKEKLLERIQQQQQMQAAMAGGVPGGAPPESGGAAMPPQAPAGQ